MSSRLNELRHGRADDVLCELDVKTPDVHEVRAVLMNLVERVQWLEKRLALLEGKTP
jgi:hypothetical protein